jgi:hypothetical protein
MYTTCSCSSRYGYASSEPTDPLPVFFCTSSRTVDVHVRVPHPVRQREKITYWYNSAICMCMVATGMHGLKCQKESWIEVQQTGRRSYGYGLEVNGVRRAYCMVELDEQTTAKEKRQTRRTNTWIGTHCEEQLMYVGGTVVVRVVLNRGALTLVQSPSC